MLRFYVEVARTAFRRQLIYRWANLAGLLTNTFFGSIFSYVIIALYHARPAVAGYNVIDTLRYTWVVQAMIMVVMPFAWYDLMLTIRSGEVVMDLSKPCDFYWYWFSREMGRNCYYLLFRGLPTYAVGMLLFGIGLPTNWEFLGAFAFCALPLGAMTGVVYRYLFNLVAFWITEARAFALFAATLALFFTGSYVPVPLFPDWLRAVSLWLPFHGLMDLPAQIFLGKVPLAALSLEIGRQGLWLLIFILIARFLTAQATRRIVIQGG